MRFHRIFLGSKLQVYKALDEKGYHDDYVTVDNFDWYMDELFQNAVKAKKKIHFKNLEGAYVDVLFDSVSFYDDLSEKVLGRSAKQIILLHENDLAALYLDSLVSRLRKNGWKILTPEESYQDEIAKRKPDTLHHRDGRIAAIANEKKYSGIIRDRFQNKEALEKIFTERKVFE